MKKKTKKKKKFKPTKRYESDHFLNREISWLEFNSRVLNEAIDDRTPLLERLKFLGIYSTNLDEFVMKRVGGLKGQFESEYSYTSIDGLTPKEQLQLIRQRIKDEMIQLDDTLMDIVKSLKKENVELLRWDECNEVEHEYLRDYFEKNIFPILTPLSVDSGKPFPFISNLSHSYGVFLEDPREGGKIFSRVKIPPQVTPWILIPRKEKESYRFISAAQIIRNNLHKLYPGVNILSVMPFKVTRNADWEHDDDDTEDLLELIEESVNYRRLQETIRIECLEDHDEEMLQYLMSELDLKPHDLYIHKRFFDYPSLFSLLQADLTDLKDIEWRPQTMPWFNRGNIFDVIKEKDRFVHHPYENFQSSVEKLVVQASEDPDVMSIKMTLYRTEENSPFIKALIKAAEDGKQVVCLIELKARFDEKRNIHWAKKMEEAGVHVVYGIVGLKTHTKITMVVRKEVTGELLRYAHIATGNYNSKTAKLYTDMGLFTVNPEVTTELNEVFNYLTGSSLKIDYKNLLVSPINAKSTFIKLIYKQIKKAKQGEKVRIVAKMNSMEDGVISEALYEASQAGVEIILIVRGFCCLKPGVKGLSENIKVISIIGRFLEHSRVFFFSDAGKEWEGEYYIGSADWMHRNMHARVEVITPIYFDEIKEQLAEFFQVLLKDKRSAWDLKSDGSYVQRKGDENTGSHNQLMDQTLKKLKDLEP